MSWQRKSRTGKRIDKWQKASLDFVVKELTSHYSLDKMANLYLQMKNNPGSEVETTNYKFRYMKGE